MFSPRRTRASNSLAKRRWKWFPCSSRKTNAQNAHRRQTVYRGRESSRQWRLFMYSTKRSGFDHDQRNAHHIRYVSFIIIRKYWLCRQLINYSTVQRIISIDQNELLDFLCTISLEAINPSITRAMPNEIIISEIIIVQRSASMLRLLRNRKVGFVELTMCKVNWLRFSRCRASVVRETDGE